MTRTEKDALGTFEVPKDVLYGIYTARNLDNFSNISGQKVPVLFIKNLIRIKKVYALVNEGQEKLESKKARAIIEACDELLKMEDSELEETFLIDRIQSGGGTSTNMIVNEVIANIAEEEIGGSRGENTNINALDHVNMSQSSNDIFPATIRITSLHQVKKIVVELEKLISTINKKVNQWQEVTKVGRTHIQDALQMKLSEEFGAFARSIEKNLIHIKETSEELKELNLGATAIGSKQNVTDEIRSEVIKETSKEFGIEFRMPKDYFEMTSTSGDFEKMSAALASLSTDIIKISSDLRLLTSGPRAGINELKLPAVQPGSSIMPGKVNPSIPEALTMISFQVIGFHHSIQLCTLHAQLQLQVFSPVIAFSLYDSFSLLTKGLEIFRTKCIEGIEPNIEGIKSNFENSFVYATEYSEKLGYDKVADLVNKAYENNLNLRDILEEEVKNNDQKK